MTTYSIVVSGSWGSDDITAQTRIANLERDLNNSAATLDLECMELLADPDYVMGTITLTIDGVKWFSGTVKSQSDFKRDSQKCSRLRCVDDTDRLQRRLVIESYTVKTAKQIITDICSKYAPWVNVSAVKDIGGTIEELRFDYDTIAGAIEKIAELTGSYWFLDAGNVLHFFADYDSNSPIDFTAAGLQPNIQRNSFTLQTTALDLVNRVWIIGARAASSSYQEQYYTGDGNNQIFSIAFEPNYPEVFENGVEKTIETDKGATSEKDYTYDKKNKVLKRTAGPLSAGVSLKFRYRPTVQVIDYFEDGGSVRTYGLYEKAIRDKKIVDRAAARKRGRAELKKSKNVLRLPSWDSRSWKVTPGQLTQVSVPSFDFNSPVLIKRVSVSLSPADVVATIDGQEVLDV